MALTHAGQPLGDLLAPAGDDWVAPNNSFKPTPLRGAA
jgi:hypothetical protein